MPSKNSINKPKDNLIRQRKSHLASKRRQRRAQQSVTVIKTSQGTTAIVPITNNRGGVIANTIISKKKAKKMERNLKYAEMRRNNKINTQSKGDTDVDMKIDTDVEVNNKGGKESAIRKALWTIVENEKVSGVPLAIVVGEGTTLGGPSF